MLSPEGRIKWSTRWNMKWNPGDFGMGALEFTSSVFGFRCMNLGFWSLRAHKNKSDLSYLWIPALDSASL